MSTNQEIYAETGIQVSDIQAIAAKFNYSAPYSQEQVELMKQMKVEAAKAKTSIKKFLATIEVGEPAQPVPDQQPSEADENIAAQRFHSSLATATQGLTTTVVELYATLDEHLTTHEEAFSTAVLNRVMASPVNCMTLVAEKLGVKAPQFFRLAPEGAALASFAVPGIGGEANAQAALKSAVDTDAPIVQ
jgi:aspartate/methionine/tyrosine aminotransferase